MNLGIKERDLLHAVAQSHVPVAMSDFFPGLNRAVPPHIDAPDDAPVRVAWVEEQFDLFRASVTLWQRELVTVVHPANGERPDLVEATVQGHAALA